MSKMAHNPKMYALIILALLLPALAGCSREPANAALTPPPPPTVTVSKPLEKQIAPNSSTSRH